MKHGLKLTSLTFSLLAFGYMAHAQPSSQTYRDWTVTCDNVKTCMAFSTSANSEGGLAKRPISSRRDARGSGQESWQEGWMSIERTAGPNSVATILISRPELASMQIPPDSKLHLLGANGRVIAGGVFAATLGGRGAIEIAPSLVGQFLNSARAATHLVLVVGPVKRRVFFVSLSGLVASGRAIDAHQGRTGTTGALVDIGRKANTAVPAVPALPPVAIYPFTKRAYERAPNFLMERRNVDCDDAQRFDAGGSNIQSFDMGRGRILWSVPCGAGAYNTWNRFYLAPPRGALMRAQFLRPVAVEGQDDMNIVNAVVDPAKGLITSFSKARGLGDCGSDETYGWDGRDFVLTSSREMVPCGGITSEFWPSSYQARMVLSAPGRR